MSKQALIEAFKNSDLTEHFGTEVNNQVLIDVLHDDIVDNEYVDHKEWTRVSKVGDRYFEHTYSEVEGTSLDNIIEVEPYNKTVTRYRPK